MPDDLDSIAIALYVQDGGRMCEWYATDFRVRNAYRLLAAKEKAARPDGAGGECMSDDDDGATTVVPFRVP